MEDNLNRLVRQFEVAEEASQNGRRDAERARDYYDGAQLTDDERRVLAKRRQPPVVSNLIKPKIDYLRGLERQGRTDPKAYPRTEHDDEAANAATDALRYVARDQSVDIKRSAVFENMLIEGFGGAEVTVAKTKGGIDPKITYIAWDRLFADPHSSAHDYADAAYKGYVTWMDAEAAKARFEGKDAVIDATVEKPTSSATDTYEDKPKWTYWADKTRKRVRIVTQYYKTGGVWHWCIYTLAGMLQESEPSPYLDDEGRPECPLILQSAYIDRDNDRYGIVRDMFDPQDEVNKRRSKGLHLINSRQVRISRASGIDKEVARRELARPDGIIIADQGEVEVLQTTDMTAGHFNMYQDAKTTLERMGPNATMQGKAGQDQSGRAILALQQGGMVEMAPLLDALRHFNIRLYRQVWNRIRQFWTDERWVRITDDERNVRFTVLNTTQGALAMRKLGEAVKSGQVDMDTARQYEQQILNDPRMAQPANAVGELDVDIDIDEVAETPTLQAEQFDLLAKMAQGGIPIPPDVLIEASGLRNKAKLLKMLEESRSQPNPMQELQQRGAAAEVAKSEAEVGKTQAETEYTAAKAQSEALKPAQAVHEARMAGMNHAAPERADA